MSVLVVIPARYASTRYPGKPLVELRGATGQAKSLIQRTWEVAQQVQHVDRVVIATDDDRIAAAARGFGAEVVMTSPEAQNGTERCAEAHAALGNAYDIVVNLQGDAPLTPPWFVSDLVEGLRGTDQADMATPILRTEPEMLAALKADRAAGRVGGTTAVIDRQSHGLYFSKEVLPFSNLAPADPQHPPVWHHVGVYAYRAEILAEYPTWAAGPLELSEGLEQLRFLERGAPVLCVEVLGDGRPFWELNNPEDVPRIETILAHLQVE